MAHKRKAQEAFGGTRGQLSAFAAAKLAKQPGLSSSTPSSEQDLAPDTGTLAAVVAIESYDGHHSGRTTPEDLSANGIEPITPPNETGRTRLSTFSPHHGNAGIQGNIVIDTEDCFEFLLQPDETVVFVGEYDISVLNGAITIYGGVIRSGGHPQRVYAPSNQALPQIQGRLPDSTVCIQSIKSSVQKLQKLSPLFRNLWAANPEQRRSFAFVGTTEDDPLHRPLRALEIDQDTDTVLRTISANTVAEPFKPRILIAGGKSSGKSTFSRVLLNHLKSWTPVTRCHYLDLDPGQPEFGPSGMISLLEVGSSLLGPPFTHPASMTPEPSEQLRLLRSHAIAAATFKDDPAHYKACVADLVRHYDKQYPLVVNSCGWVSGLGASVLSDLVPLLRITDLVLLEPMDGTIIDAMQTRSNQIQSYRIPRRAPRPASRTPAESRAMQTMAYFHHKGRVDRDGDIVPRWSGKALNRRRPWVVTYAGPCSGIFAVASYGQSPHPELLAEVLDGSIVALVVLQDAAPVLCGTASDGENTSGAASNSIARTPEDIPYLTADSRGINRTIEPESSYCVGLALVSGIDASRKEIHLVTPLPETQISLLMGKKVVLVRGSFDPPGWAYLEDLYKSGENAAFPSDERPWVSRKGMVGIEGAVWRLRHPPMPSAVAPSR